MRSAKDYFRGRMEEDKVRWYLDLLYKNARTTGERQKYEKEKFDFRKELMDGDFVKKELEKARNATFSLSTVTVEAIR